MRNEGKLPAEEKQRIYHFMDLIIRDHAAKKAYSSYNKGPSETLEPVF